MAFTVTASRRAVPDGRVLVLGDVVGGCGLEHGASPPSLASAADELYRPALVLIALGALTERQFRSTSGCPTPSRRAHASVVLPALGNHGEEQACSSWTGCHRARGHARVDLD